MTLSELRELLLYEPLTTESYKKLPPETGEVWLTRPSQDRLENGKRFMYLRLALIAAFTLYCFFQHRVIGEAQILPLLILTYEVAYHMLWKEKIEREQLIAQESYVRRVDELLRKLYPSWAHGTKT